MKKIVREFQFSSEESEQIKSLARALDLTETTAGILFARGINTEEKMRAFLSPSAEHFLSPFLMRGMKEAVALLTQAKEEGWRVAVFGDYDADGIGALAVLSRALKRFGIEPYLYVPERTDGYGMSVSALDAIFDEFMPDLIVTVDCGISNAEEVEYIKEQGAYVIVTDHHELPERLPDCITVNPKFKDDYPYDNLCGAGVAFKLAVALLGESAYDLVDFAAISTVADSVPLLDENRDIVAEGLKRITQNPRPAIAALLGDTAPCAQSLAFTVAPRINAAGRMGDARAALRLFTTDDEEEITRLAELLNRYNASRQKFCDEMGAQAKRQALAEGAYSNVIMIAGCNWNAGFLGIAAARLAEEFSRPALLFAKHGDHYRGSARSIDGVNIFEALKACSADIEEFGGHSQAAGVNVKEENFERLKRSLDAYIGAHYAREDFLPSVFVCGEGLGADKKFVRELNALEPFGVGNRRPLFTAEAGHTQARLLKPASPHVAIDGCGFDFMYFGGAKELDLLRSDVNKTLVFEYNVSTFRGREQLKGIVRSVVCRDTGAEETDLTAFEFLVRSLAEKRTDAEALCEADLNAFLAQKTEECAYGLCAVYYNRETLSRFPALAGISSDVFRLSSGSVANALLFAPAPDCDLSPFREVVFLDAPPVLRLQTGNARVLASTESRGLERLRALSAERENLLSVFAQLRTLPLIGSGYAEAAVNFGAEDKELFVFALNVFEELGLISDAGGRYEVNRGVRTDLRNSAAYNVWTELKNGG